jgi:IS5 family transposase
MQEAILPLAAGDEHLPKTVREFHQKYKGISRILDEHPEILVAAHEDLKNISHGGPKGAKERKGKIGQKGKIGRNGQKGRSADFTSETILRALVVHNIEGGSLRDTELRIAESEFLQDFVRTRKKAALEYSFLDRCFQAIRPATWKRLNELLGRKAEEEEKIDPTVIRTDTTVVETNIHWPTDSSLLWDTWRVASRLLKRGRKIARETCPHRFHDRKTKRLHLFITRYAKSPSKPRQRKVKRAYRALIKRVEQIVEIATFFCRWAPYCGNLELDGVVVELKGFLPSMKRVVIQSRRAKLEGETVPAAERVYSIFEPHTELIKRGRREKPVEFGHAVLLCQTPEKFITDYEAFAERPADCRLTEQVIGRHEKLFDEKPKVLAGDKGFCPDGEKYAELAEQVETLAIPRRMRDFADKVLAVWQMFRAGIEGTISGLKRAFRLARCYYRGFNRFQAALGLGVFAHNLVVLAKQGMT